MTKPNELTLAIERVEGGFHHACDWRPETEPGCGACPACLDNAALRLVIEAAKRPTALSGEERKTLTQVLERHMAYARASPISLDVKRFMDALTAALSLKQPPPLLRLDSDGSVTELKPEEREALAWMRDDLYKVVDEIPTPKVPKTVRLAALTAALSLASPFTEEEWRWLREQVHPQYYYRSDQDHADAISAKLDAMLAQSSPANS